MLTSARLSIDPARYLIFSPAWNGEGVVFDARSGDYWVVSEAVYNLLRVVNGETPANDDMIVGNIDAEIIASLGNHGIICSPSSF